MKLLLFLFLFSCSVVEPVAPQKQMIEELPAISLLAYRISDERAANGTRVTVYLYSHSPQKVTIAFYDVGTNAWSLLASKTSKAPGEITVDLPPAKWAVRIRGVKNEPIF